MEKSPPALAADGKSGPRRWKWAQLYGIALVATICVDLLGEALYKASPNTAQVLQYFQNLNASVAYGLGSSRVDTLVGNFSQRLSGDRYHWAVLSWGAPFNLSEACRTDSATIVGGRRELLCLPPPDLRQAPRGIAVQISLPLRSTVNEAAYPRHAGEYLLGLPDAFLHTFLLAWHGSDYGDRSIASVKRRSNWFGKLVLLLVIVAAFGVAIGASSRRDEPWEVLGTFGLCFLLFLLWGTCIALVVALTIGLVTWLSGGVLMLTSMLVSGILVPPLLWMFKALVELGTDQVKGRVEQHLDRLAEKPKTEAKPS